MVVGSGLYVFGGTVEFSQNARSAEMFRFNLTKTAPCTLHRDLVSLLQSEELCDLELVVPGERGGVLKAHACIVAARSAMLRKHILDALQSSTEVQASGEAASTREAPATEAAAGSAFASPAIPHIRLELPEAPSLDAMAAVLHFMYSDELAPEHIGVEITASDLPRLLDVCDCAGLFGVQRLELLCTQSIRRAASADSVLEMLQVRLRIALWQACGCDVSPRGLISSPPPLALTPPAFTSNFTRPVIVPA